MIRSRGFPALRPSFRITTQRIFLYHKTLCIKMPAANCCSGHFHYWRKDACPSLLTVSIDEFWFQLGVQNLLSAIQSVITRQHITNCTGDCKQHQPLCAKKLHTQHQRGQRTVHHPAKKSDQPDCRSKGRAQSQQLSDHTTKRRPHKKVGTISPPLNPAPNVRAVNNILRRKASGLAWPPSAASITCIPAPL